MEEALAIHSSDKHSDVFVFLDLVMPTPGLHGRTEEYDALTRHIKGLHLVQTVGAWDNAERLRRLWMMLESSACMAAGGDITLAMSAGEFEPPCMASHTTSAQIHVMNLP